MAARSGTQHTRKTPKPAERLIVVKRMMSENRWREGESDQELAEEWGCDASTVRHTAAEASRAIRSHVADGEFASRLVSILLDNVTNAREARRYEAVARSCEVAAKIAGIDGSRPPEEPTTVQITVVGPDSNATPEG